MRLDPQQLSVAAALIAQEASREFLESMDGDDWIAESPLEANFLVWYYAFDAIVAVSRHRFNAHVGQPILKLLRLRPQHRVTVDGTQYRIDFVVVPGHDDPVLSEAAKLGVKLPKIAVELDGHEFHERTPEQVIHRDTRDRRLQSDGWRVFHFSWAEMHACAIKCAAEVYLGSYTEYQRFLERLNEARAESMVIP